MRPTPINSAETVFEAFHDPHISEFDQWTVDAPGVTGSKVWQNWIWVQWEWQQSASDGLVVRFRRELDLDCSSFDRLIVCAAMPEGGSFTLHAETDAGLGGARRGGGGAGER